MTPFFSILSSFSLLYPTIDIKCLFVWLGFSLLLKVCWIVFYTSIAKHITSGFLIDFVHTELSRTPFSKRSFGNFRSRSAECLLAILTNVRGFQVSYFRPYWDERIIIYTRYFPIKKCEVFTPRIHHIIYSFL